MAGETPRGVRRQADVPAVRMIDAPEDVDEATSQVLHGSLKGNNQANMDAARHDTNGDGVCKKLNSARLTV